MTNFNLIDLMKNTKQMLVAYIREQDRSIAQHAKVIGDLKQEIEMLKAQGAATKGQSIPSRRHTYADRAEAAANCKRLASSPLNAKYVFTQQGCDVIVRPRVH